MGNIVRDYYDGNTRVIICDDAYRNRSAEEQRKSWENLCRIASEALHNQEIMKRDKENKKI
jgi:hypothetical protein